MKLDKSKITILIVDDTPEDISIIEEYLSDYKVKVAINGAQAISILESGVVPAIILLDIIMPGINGYEVCRRIKNNYLTKDIPIIFITAMTELEDKIKGFQLGAVDYITKPFQLEEVRSRIETHISLSIYRRELENMNDALEQKVKERTRELLLEKVKAEEANKLKSHFLALMSHELRTPMVGILGYSEILLDEITEPKLKNFSKYLNDSALRLTETIDSILQLSQFESNSQVINYVLFNMTDRVNELLKSHLYKASAKGLELTLINKLQTEQIILDITMFDIIFHNLLSNAVKFTEKGTVTVELYNEVINGKEFSCISVADTGIGIPESKHKIIFEEFRQVYEGIQRNFEGVGLGLSLIKKYVDKLDGIILLESKVGRGSKFTVKLVSVDKIQLERKKILAKTAPQKHFNKMPRILVVEDDPINVKITKLFLNNIAELDVANDGKSAIQLAKNNNYAAILMDINLGQGLSGIEVIKIVKEFDNYKDTPIIACTAFAMDGDKENFLEQGCSHYLPKPYSRKELTDLINSVVELK